MQKAVGESAHNVRREKPSTCVYEGMDGEIVRSKAVREAKALGREYETSRIA